MNIKKRKGSMIKARHNYVENCNKTISNSSNDDETDNDKREDDVSDKESKS